MERIIERLVYSCRSAKPTTEISIIVKPHQQLPIPAVTLREGIRQIEGHLRAAFKLQLLKRVEAPSPPSAARQDHAPFQECSGSSSSSHTALVYA